MNALTTQRRPPHLWSTSGTPAHVRAPIRGTFRSPSGQRGTLSGWMRLVRFVTVGDDLRVAGVFTGELVDGDGSLVGWGSRRGAARADLKRSADDAVRVEVDSIEVDLLGLCVHVEPFTLPLGQPPERVLRSVGTPGPSRRGLL